MNVDYYVNLHKELHGEKANASDILNDIHNSGIIVTQDLKEYVYSKMNPKPVGVFVARLQPFHLGHQAVINEIMLCGMKPLILLGSTNKHDEKNPLSFEERTELIRLVYNESEVIVKGQPDNKNWELWFQGILDNIKEYKDIIFFVHNKECDRLNFTYKGIDYKNEFYTKVFEIEGFKVQQIEFVDRKDFKIESNGTDIRHNIEGYKHFIDARIYWKLKEKGWK